MCGSSDLGVQDLHLKRSLVLSMSGLLRRSTSSLNALPAETRLGNEVIDKELIWRDLTFLRVVVESVYVNDTSDSIKELIRSKGLYGFIIEYQFPSIDTSSKSLGNRVQASAKSYNNNVINFRHRKIFKLECEKKLWMLWEQSCAVFTLYVQLNALGKFTRKLIGRCDVQLRGLLTVPFGICADYLFIGAGFTGSSKLRIELGSHVKSLMERLEMMRSGDFDVQRPGSGRSRSRSRQSSLPSSSHSRTATLSRSPESGHIQVPLQSPLEVTSSRSPSSVCQAPAVATYPVPVLPPNYRVHLIVHSARRLPAVTSQRGEGAPSTYVSVVANDGYIFCSPVCRSSFRPEFNWSQTFEVSEKRQNLVVKLWQKCSPSEDKVIGFVSIPLPPRTAEAIEYEMSNLMTVFQTPMITISLTAETSSPNETPVLLASPRSELSSSPVQISREEISEKLRKNLLELEALLANLKG